MAIMEWMREFSAFKEEKEAEEVVKAVEDADDTYLRTELKKYVYEDKIVDALLPAMKTLYKNEQHETLFELLSFKEDELNKLVSHKDKFEQQSSQSSKEIDTDEEDEEGQGDDPVLKYIEI